MNRFCHTSPQGARRGHTFAELVVAMASASVLVGGLASSIYIASQALQQEGGATAQRLDADAVLDDVLADVKLARYFSERTTKAATFAVPDRDGDGDPEVIRYAWSGTPGDPLTYEYNGSPPETLVEDVHDFNLAALTRAVTAPPLATGPPPGGGNLLFVVNDAASPTSQEAARKTLLESWGYTVNLISAADSQANYDTAVADNNVAYISEEINSSDLGTKLTNASIGVVNGEVELTDEFGFSSDKTWPFESDVSIVRANHYITEEFTTGPLTISTAAQSMIAVSGTLAPDLKVLGGFGSEQTLVYLAQDANLYGGGTAAARRVQLPWGGSSFDFNLLTDDGRTLLRRAIEWAAGAGDDHPTPAVLLVVSSAGIPTSQENNKQALIESWGHAVTLISDSDSQANFDAAVAANDVAYICSQVDDNALNTKLVNAAIGVVLEERKLVDEFGLAAGASNSSGTDLDIADNSHYITSSFSLGVVPIYNAAHDVIIPDGALAPDVTPLGKDGSGFPCLLPIDEGGSLAGGGTAAGRRVQLAWGNDSFDSASLTADGQTIMKRAIEWAAGAGAPAGGVVFEEFTEAKRSSNGSSLTIVKPPGTAAGDLLIAAVATDGDTKASLAAPAGWTQIVVEERFGAVTFSVWWKIATGFESGTYAFTWSGSERAYGWMMRFTGHDPSNPINAWAMTTTGSGTTLTPPSPAVTTTVNNAMILRLGGFDDDDINVDDPGLPGHTAITMDESSNGSGTASGGAGYVIQPAAGDSGTSTFTTTDEEQSVTVTLGIAPN